MPALRLALGTLILLAFASTGFAHRAPDAGLQRFLAAGGDLAAICNDTGTPHHADHRACDACQLVGAALVPAGPRPVDPLPAGRTAADLPAVRLSPPAFRDPARHPRAPPVT